MAIDIDNSKINYDVVKPNREDYTDFKVYWADLCYYLIQKYKDTYVKVQCGNRQQRKCIKSNESD